jgi:hypothetical protein
MAAKFMSFICGPNIRGLALAGSCFPWPERDLHDAGHNGLVVWALSDNEPAVNFYRALGGRAVARSTERFGTKVLDKVAFAWTR